MEFPNAHIGAVPSKRLLGAARRERSFAPEFTAKSAPHARGHRRVRQGAPKADTTLGLCDPLRPPQNSKSRAYTLR